MPLAIRRSGSGWVCVCVCGLLCFNLEGFVILFWGEFFQVRLGYRW